LIDSKLLLNDLRKLLKTLERDLRERCENQKEINAPVRAEYEAAKKAGRTVAPFEWFYR
jgi:CRISPR/Cas system CSM-associated protein Csm2 small subunit